MPALSSEVMDNNNRKTYNSLFFLKDLKLSLKVKIISGVVPSQCFVVKNAFNDRGLMSICTKLVVQMNAKLGGEPWTVSIPLRVIRILTF